MPQLLFPGTIDFTLSEIDANGYMTVCMFIHEQDASNVYADHQLSYDDLIAIQEWITKEISKRKGAKPA